jgi:hypothetical protein
MRHTCFLVLATATAAYAAGFAATADAAGRGRDRSGTVTVCSRFDTKCISGPTRPGRNGLEVRMPGGTWIDCQRDCRDTLRVATIDFWAQREQERGGGEWRR